MGIFYHPPPPAGRTAVTPPEPHVPIGTQGSQPPRYKTALMLENNHLIVNRHEDVKELRKRDRRSLTCRQGQSLIDWRDSLMISFEILKQNF